MIDQRWSASPSERATSNPNVWLLQHGPCWCRGLPGDSGSFDLMRFRSSHLELGEMRINLLIVSERVMVGSGPTCKQVYDSIPDPKVVISTGSCPAARRFWDDSLIGWTHVSELLPVYMSVDACIFGEPEALLEPVLSLTVETAMTGPTRLTRAGSN